MLKKNKRLSREDVVFILKRGKIEKGIFFVLRYLTKETKDVKLTVVVSHGVSKDAVTRNKLKRRMRHIIKKHEKKIKKGVGIVIIFKKNKKNATFSDLEKEYLVLLNKTKLCQN